MDLHPAQVANRVLEETESTNDLARKLGDAGFPHGTWVSARVQTAGRGRAGRRWESFQPGNLFLSMVARDLRHELWTWIPLATACAVVAVVRSLFPSIMLEIKWPNDLWLRENEGFSHGYAHGYSKMGGILCEASSFVVIGLGLNCIAHPEVDQATTSLSRALGRAVIADDIRADIVAGIIDRLELLKTAGPEAIAHDFLRYSALPAGTEIEWGNNQGSVLGLGPSGELRVRSQGREISLYADDVKIRLAARGPDETDSDN